MPKEVFEIKKFDLGVATSPSSSDVNSEAAIMSENVESIAKQGQITGIPTDTNFYAFLRGTEFAEVQNEYITQTDLLVYDNSGSQGHIKKLRDAYDGQSNLATVASLGNKTIDWAVNNQELYIGTGGGSGDKPKLVEYVGRKFFGTNTYGWQSYDAECYKPDWITISVADGTGNVASGADFSDNTAYYYAISAVYDDYQESPLKIIQPNQQTGANSARIGKISSASNLIKEVDVSISWYSTNSNISSRITGLKVYRGESTLGYNQAQGFFRYIGKIDVKDNAGWNTSTSTYTYTFTDLNDELGASFDSTTGFSQTLESTNVNYGLSTIVNNSLVVANCYVEDINNPKYYIFKSKAFRFSTFDWSSDYLKLNFLPTALTQFAGRLYVFGENRLVKINPDLMMVEDEFEGAGCLNKDCFVVTEYGMCFADSRNIYIHDGSGPTPIGLSIIDGHDLSWLNRDTSYKSFILFDNKRKAFLIFFRKNSKQYAWAFNIGQKRWDLYYLSNGTFEGGYNSLEGDAIISDGTNLVNLFTGSSKRSWSWESGDSTMGVDSQRKIFFKLHINGSSGLSTQHSVDQATLSTASTSSEISLPTNTRKGKSLKVKVSGDGTKHLNSIGIIMRRLPIK